MSLPRAFFPAACALLAIPLAAQAPALRASGTTLEKLLPLRPEEGVFAYSRISSDGQVLAFASETTVNGKLARTTNFIDLKTKKVLHAEPGLDSYWAPDGKRIIFLSTKEFESGSVCIWDRETGKVTRDVAPIEMGDYFSWAVADGKDLILTQENRYYTLEGGKAIRPYRSVSKCPVIGTGSAPMISRDGKLIATFFQGTLVVRSLKGCDFLLETKLPGGKADFSFDGRYIAFHSPKDGGKTEGFDIKVVDLQERTVRKVTDLEGSSYYPSWTRDGRLAFRYDSKDYRGFMMASNVLANPATPLPTTKPDVPGNAPLARLFKDGPAPRHKVVLVNFWAGWCVHCRAELPVLDKLRGQLKAAKLDAEILGVCEPSSFPSDRDAILKNLNLTIPQARATAPDLVAYGVQAYPTSLLFVDGKLVERKTGAQTYDKLVEWLRRHGVTVPKGKG